MRNQAVVGVIWVIVLALAAGSCARPYPPTGGDPDETPPRLLGTTPEPLEVIAPTEQPVVFTFDDRLSERNFSEALVIVSPLDGALRVERGRNQVRVAIDGGWRPDRVYRVVLLPGIRDLFGNQRTDAVELVFSTGPPVVNTAVAGLVLDRITGQPALNPVIEAVRRADSVRYMAVGDSGGFFALRHMPPGVYEMRAYSDANRNRRRDRMEPVDSGQVASLAVGDTVTQMFEVLAPDTTGPTVTDAAVIDSLHVRVVLDDYVTADAVARGSARVLTLPDSADFTAAEELLLEPVYQAVQRAASPARAAPPAQPADTIAADTAAVDTAAVRTDPVAAARADSIAAALTAAAAARADSAIAVARERPARELVIRLGRPLEPGTEYIIIVSGLENLHGITGGGSEAFETEEPPEPPPPAAIDTTSVMVHRRQ